MESVNPRGYSRQRRNDELPPRRKDKLRSASSELALGGELERLADSSWPVTASHAVARNSTRVATLKADVEVFPFLMTVEHLDVGLRIG